MRWIEAIKGETSDVKSALFYLVRWPLSAPWDAWRAGEGHHKLTRILAWLVPGLPVLGARLIVGPLLATWYYYRSRRFD